MDKIEQLQNQIKILEDKLDFALNEIDKLKNGSTLPIIGDPFVFLPPKGSYNPFL